MTDRNNLDIAVAVLIEQFCKEVPQSAAQKIETMSTEDAVDILGQVPFESVVPVWEALPPNTAAEFIDVLSVNAAKEILEALNPGKATSILLLVEREKKDELLAVLDSAIAQEIEELIAYPPDSAARLMDTRFQVYRGDMTVADAQKILRRTKSGQPVYELRLIDEQQRFNSVVDIKDLAIAKPSMHLNRIAHPIVAVVKPMDTKEKITDKMQQYRLEELTVIDEDGHIVGVIRYSALIGALKESASLDIQTMVGVSKDERATSSSWLAVRKRMPWLQVNLLTAFLAAAVVGLFEGTIAKFTALAILLPVVAGQSGNAGAQALAVTMRGLALHEIRLGDWLKMARKEANVGIWNGISIAIVCGAGVYFWSGQFGLVLVICSSMIIAMVLAGLAGALVPMGLKKLSQDPAVASSIVLTTITDIVGFFSFLGIATLLSGILA